MTPTLGAAKRTGLNLLLMLGICLGLVALGLAINTQFFTRQLTWHERVEIATGK